MGLGFRELRGSQHLEHLLTLRHRSGEWATSLSSIGTWRRSSRETKLTEDDRLLAVFDKGLQQLNALVELRRWLPVLPEIFHVPLASRSTSRCLLL